MKNEKLWLAKVAQEYCLPAIEKAINDFKSNKQYTITDHVSYSVTRLEAVLRPLWGFAPLLKTGRKFYINSNGENCELSKQIREIILEGTDEKSDMCFSKYAENTGIERFANQVITEIAGYMTAVFFAKEALWDPYSEQEKQQVASWIRKWAIIALKHSWPNNHYWFPMLSIIALEKMGIDCGNVDKEMKKGFDMLDKMYISDGWYMDGEFGRFDYYLAWSHHVYPALWALLAKGTKYYDEERVEIYKKRTEDFLKFYVHVFDGCGAHVPFGRSLSYRFASTAIFPAAAILDCRTDYGICRRIMLDNINYFLENSILTEDGVLPVGYLYESPLLAENYTSEGGAYWCSKAFLALCLEDDSPFWQEEEKEYPAQKSEYLIKPPIPEINVLVENTKNAGITMYNNTISYVQNGVFIHHFNDTGACYSKFVYNSKAGFALSSADNKSLDNMISLSTEDCTMFSARAGFCDLGIHDGVLVSEHIPFANDKESVIKTWILPLGGGYHIRAHRVTLRGRYRVLEGGFCCGYFNDNNTFTVNENGACYKTSVGLCSRMYSLSNTHLSYELRKHHPGMHIIAPQSGYPIFKTDVLDPGTYYFASVFGFMTEESIPEIMLENKTVYIKYKNTERIIELK